MALSKLGLDRARPFVTWPDNFQGWLPAALALALREIRRSRPDVLYTTSAPYVSHLAGLALHRMTGIPWVADFRDEWAANPHLAGGASSSAQLSRRAERAVARAPHVVVVGDYFDIAGSDRGTARRSPTASTPTDLAGCPRPTRRRTLPPEHVGTLYGDQDAAPVIAALRRLSRGESSTARASSCVWSARSSCRTAASSSPRASRRRAT